MSATPVTTIRHTKHDLWYTLARRCFPRLSMAVSHGPSHNYWQNTTANCSIKSSLCNYTECHSFWTMDKNGFCYSLSSPLRICLLFSLSSGDCSKTPESLIRMKICFIAQQSQQYSSLGEILTIQTQLSMLPPFSSHPTTLPCAIHKCPLFLSPVNKFHPKSSMQRDAVNSPLHAQLPSHLQLALFSSQLLHVISFLTPPFSDASRTGVLTLRSWYCDYHCGKKNTAVTSQRLGFSAGWSYKKSVPWMLTWFGLSERNTFHMDLSLV